MTRAELEAVVDIIKRRFSNLSIKETVDFAVEILEALEQIHSKS